MFYGSQNWTIAAWSMVLGTFWLETALNIYIEIAVCERKQKIDIIVILTGLAGLGACLPTGLVPSKSGNALFEPANEKRELSVLAPLPRTPARLGPYMRRCHCRR